MTHAELIGQISELRDWLGRTLVAATAGAPRRELVDHWIDESATPDEDEIERLQLAHRLFSEVAAENGEDNARSWFIGPNVREKISPFMAIRCDNFDDAMASAARQCEN